MKVNSLVIALFSFFFCIHANCDILFLDLNMSSMEIAAARRAASARGEKLIVIPNISDEKRKVIEAAQTNVYQYTGYLATNCAQDASGRNDLARVEPAKQKKCADIAVKEEAAKEEFSKIKERESINKEFNLTDELKKIKATGATLSSLIISGHDGHGSFSGTNGKFNSQQIQDAFFSTKPLGDEIRSLALWGCESATPGAAAYFWQPILPRIEIIAGFDGVAPSNNRKAGHDYLENFLKKEKELTTSKDQKSLKSAFKRIEGVNVVTASVCTNKFFVSHKKSYDLAAEIKNCVGELGTKKLKRMLCIQSMTGECKSMNQAEIRQNAVAFYNDSVDYDACSNRDFNLYENSIKFLSRDQLQRLIKFDTVIENFKKNHVQELAEISKIVTQVDPKKKYNIDFSKAVDWPSYVQLHEKLKQLIAENGKMNDSIDNPDYVQMQMLKSLMYGLHRNLSQLDAPFEMTEVGSNFKISDFSRLLPQNVKAYKERIETEGARDKLYYEKKKLVYEELSKQKVKPYSKEYYKLYDQAHAEANIKLKTKRQEFIKLEKSGLNRPNVIAIYESGQT